MTESVDIVVIGAGVVGLAIAAQLASSGREVLVLEQHDLIGSETSSRNSEVIHAGIYYREGSLKARLCVRGKKLLYQHCKRFQVPFRQCGKLIVASDDTQERAVKGYIHTAAKNGVHDLCWLDASAVADLEPDVKCVGAVLSPSTGIIDSHAYMLSLQGILESHGGMIAFNTQVTGLEEAGQAGIVVRTAELGLNANWVINSAGLHAPRIAALLTDAPTPEYAIGHYYTYSGANFSRLIYPMAEVGGLGVHVTLDLAGQVKFGPDVRWIDELNYAFDDSCRDEFIRAIQRYFPGIDPARLQPGYTGIRPKLAHAPVQDFRIDSPQQHGVAGLVNLLGIESPGLTASLAIAEEVQQVIAA